ncbi:STAS domain-containing protein [Streptacidiphilus neutrinimicus]|uniref:STAS domain-containing protein n=1 Tax=Streptacidiphilus neutrinimicus TaxID=105420 RepID=UPI0005AACF42|nr:STAS domain-containing protein [Streptacidiphilus neutrinimicus]
MTDHVLAVTTQAHPTGAAVVTVEGELEYSTAANLRQAIEAAPFTTAGVVLDLTALTYCDSTGLTALLAAQRRAQAAAAPLALAGMSEDLQHVFSIVGLDQIFTLHADVDQAIAAFRDARARE